jgi:hypothetical protein
LDDALARLLAAVVPLAGSQTLATFDALGRVLQHDVRSSLDPNTFFDVATYGRRAIELVIETFGVHQLVYGSDTPVVDPRRTLDAVRGFGDSVTYVLQSETPSALLT